MSKKIKLLSKQKDKINSAFNRLSGDIVLIEEKKEINNKVSEHKEFKNNPEMFGYDGSKPLDNINWERFCRIYTTESEFFGNGVNSYIQAYDLDESEPGTYSVASASATRLLKKVSVMARINYLLDNLILNDAHVDKQMAYLITQNAQLQPKLGAIQEYNKLRNRINEKQNNTNVIVFGPNQVEHFKKRDDMRKKLNNND